MFGGFSEAAFVFSSVSEFVKAWDSGTDSKLVLETRNGRVQMTFSCDLGKPSDDHFKPTKRFNKNKPKTKSKQRRERDNHRAMLHQQRLSSQQNDSATESQDVSVPMETSVDATSETVDATNVVDEEATEENKGDDTINLPTRVEALEKELKEIIESSENNEARTAADTVAADSLRSSEADNEKGWHRTITVFGKRAKLKDLWCWKPEYDRFGVNEGFWSARHRECLEMRHTGDNCSISFDKVSKDFSNMNYQHKEIVCWRARTILMMRDEVGAGKPLPIRPPYEGD